MVPTLTEVIDAFELPAVADAGTALKAETPVAAGGVPETAGEMLAPPSALDEEPWTQRVLLEVQRQVDLAIEARLREALLPVFERAVESLAAAVRPELAAIVRDAVNQAVAQEAAHRRQR